MLKFGSAWRVLASIVAAIGVGAVTFISIYRSDIGCRYFMPGELGRSPVVVHIASPRLPITDNSSPNHSAAPHRAAAFLTRSIGLRAGEEQAWGRHNGITDALSFSHHLDKVIPRELYARHPEFFPLVEGGRLQPRPGAVNSNPDLGREDVARYAASQAAAEFAAHPDAVSFSLGINDAFVFGESAETLALTGVARSSKAETLKRGNADKLTFEQVGKTANVSASQPWDNVRWFRGRPDFSRLVFTFMNRAATELAKTHPDKYLGCLAYYWAENTPPFRVDPHVIPFLTADRSQSYDPAFRREEIELQEKWGAAVRGARTETLKSGNADTLKSATTQTADGIEKSQDFTRTGSQNFSVSDFQHFDAPASQRFSVSQPHIAPRLGLYDYLDGQGFLVPRVPIHAFAEHVKHAHAVGFTDYYGESSRNWGLDGPMPWVIAQLLQHPDRDVDALLDEYYTTYFRSAAEPMRRFFERCEQQWMQQSGTSYWLKYYRSQSQADLFPPEVCRELRGLLNQAQQALTTKDTKGHEGSNRFLQKGSEGRTGDRRQGTGDSNEARRSAPLTPLPPVQKNLSASVDSNQIRSKPFLQERTEGTENKPQTEGSDQTRSPLSSLPPVQKNLPEPSTKPRQVSQEGAEGRTGDRRQETGTNSRSTGSDFSLSAFQRFSVSPELVRDRVAFVSDSFGVTERFVAFQAARANLATKTLRGQATATDLEQYEQRRSEFIRYAHTITAKWPLAFYPINYDDWLRDDPAFAAMRQIAGEKLNQADSFSVFRNFSVSAFPSARVSAFPAAGGRDILPDGDLNGPLQRGRRIAGLQYGIDLPASWQSKVEPMEHGVAVLETLKSGNADTLTKGTERQSKRTEDKPQTAGSDQARSPFSPLPPAQTNQSQSSIKPRQVSQEGAKNAEGRTGDGRRGPGDRRQAAVDHSRVADDSFQRVSVSDFQRFNALVSPRFVRFSGQENATLYQWLRAKPGVLYAASVQTRGRVTSSDAVTLTLGWLDARQRPIGNPIVMRLPDGDWPDWVSLQQGGYAPANAAWVGIGVRVQHQIASESDYADFARFKLVEFEPQKAETLKR